MSYDPTERASQPPDQQSPYGQAPQPSEQPTSVTPPPAYSQSNPALPTYEGQPTQMATPPAYSQSNPNLPPYGGQVPQTPPAYSQSNPNLPPYGQAPVDPAAYGQYAQPMAAGAYAPQQPVDPYAPVQAAPGQPPHQSGQSWGAGMPPAYAPVAPPKKKRGLLIAIISVIVVVLLVAGGVIGYVVTRPKPVISVTSTYNNGATPLGATGTTFSVKGTDFTGNSLVTFLLDGATVPGGQAVESDSNGAVSATLTVTDAWGVSNHKITAKDSAGYLTQVSKAITIVVPGQSKTPGPNGAPTDSASGTINANVQAGSSSGAITLSITGSPNGGTVCSSRDNGQPQVRNEPSADGNATETIVQTCSGTYKNGKLSYTETVTSDKIVFTSGAVSGVSCVAQTPYVSAHLEGTFTSGTSVSGSYSDDAVTATCSLGGTSRTDTTPSQTGTWTGNASMQ